MIDWPFEAFELVSVSVPAHPPPPPVQEQVVLLHGLCRGASSMRPMQKSLEAAGFSVSNIDYPSRSCGIEDLSEKVIGQIMAAARAKGGRKVHFVTHSLGGILVRQYAAKHPDAAIGKVVMLGPPNGGSEVVDRIGAWSLFSMVNGPAGGQLATHTESLPKRLGPARFPVGVIAGNRSINWINSLMIPGPDDGKVSVESTKLEGMADHLVIATSHPFIMRDREAMTQTIEFLRHGKFRRMEH